MFYVHNTLDLKFQKYWYCGIFVANVSNALSVLLILVNAGLKVVLLVNETPLSFAINCIVSDDATFVDVLV